MLKTIWRSLFMLLAVIPLSPWQSYAQAATPPPAAPIIFCAEPWKDFGTLNKGARGEHLFLLENRGSAPLSITSAQPSCTCTAVELSQQLIAPGDSFTLRAKMDSTPFEGPVEKLVFLASNDPAKPVLALVLRAKVQNPYQVTPHTVHIQSLGRHAALEIPIQIRRQDGKRLTITGASLRDLPNFTLQFTPCTEGLEHRFQLRFEPGASTGNVNGSIVLSFADTELPSLAIPVDARIHDDIRAFPERLTIADTAPGQVLPQRILLSIHNPSIEIATVTVEPALFTAEISNRKALPSAQPGKGRILQDGIELIAFSKGVEIRLRAKEDAPLGPFRGQLRIATTSREQPLLLIPFSGILGLKESK